MSLLDKASLILTPNAYKASKLYSIVPSNGNGDMTVVRNTSATRDNSSGLVELVGNNVPRLEYDGSCPSILIEPQRTNLLTYSEMFSDVNWVKTNSTISANVTTSPDGTLTADRFSANGVNLVHQLTQFLTFTTATNYTFSMYVKADTNNFIQLVLPAPAFGANAWANFNVLNGTIGTVGSAATANIVNVGNGWFRCSITAPATTTILTTIIANIVTSATSVRSESNTLSTSLFVWGAQLEVGAYITSYIPTTTSALTRNADVISKTGISSLIGQTEGTIYAEIKVNKLIGTASRYIFSISDGTANNRIYIAFSSSSSNVLRGRIFNGGTLQCSIDTSTITTTGTYKLALAYKNNDIVFYVNGVQIGVDTSATIPTCSIVDIGHNYAGALQLSDGISNANIFKTRLTNTELQSLTTL
jgi:hypothetical protein